MVRLWIDNEDDNKKNRYIDICYWSLVKANLLALLGVGLILFTFFFIVGILIELGFFGG